MIHGPVGMTDGTYGNGCAVRRRTLLPSAQARSTITHSGLVFIVLIALDIAGVKPAGLIAGSAFTAILLALAAQQTLGNLFARLVLVSARPFRVGERIRLQAGALADVPRVW